MRSAYHTKQKEYLLEEITKLKTEFTIKELFEAFERKVGLTTIYRFIGQLENDGRIVKTIHDNHVYYQYLCNCIEENHFFLKCIHCGAVIHVDCDYVDELSKHIQKKHHFLLKKDHLIMDGICENCFSKEGTVC